MDTGIVDIHGKQYQTVAKRVADFRSEYKDFSIETEIINNADLVIIKAVIKNEKGVVVSTGYAEEVRGATKINKTSALENCETSAVGRALAFFGLGGTEIASANEVSDAVIAQAKNEVAEFFKEYNGYINKYYQQISEYKEALSNDDLLQAVGIWYDLPEDAQIGIFRLAPTKGGILTTEERNIQKSNEWHAAKKQYFEGEK